MSLKKITFDNPWAHSFLLYGKVQPERSAKPLFLSNRKTMSYGFGLTWEWKKEIFGGELLIKS